MNDNTQDKTATRASRVREASRRRRERDRQALRDSILQAAGEVFLERGYEGLSMRMVAERIGYSATTIYHHFENKDDLLFAVVDQGFERFATELAAAAESTDDPRERLNAIGRAYVRFGLNNPMHYEMMFMRRTSFLLTCRDGDTQPRIAAFGVLQQAVQQALDAGVLPPGEVLSYANMLWASVHGIVSMTIAIPHVTREHAWEALDAFSKML
jgi:AcrR family transcriptional regulator